MNGGVSLICNTTASEDGRLRIVNLNCGGFGFGGVIRTEVDGR